MGLAFHIICFLWAGDRWDSAFASLYGPRYVRRLARAVRRNLSVYQKFVCFTNINFPLKDVEDYVELRFLPTTGLRGCLPKSFMFAPYGLSGIEPGTQCLALDLDVVITGNLDEMSSYSGELCVRSKFRQDQQHKADGDIIGFKADPFLSSLLYDPLVANSANIEMSTGGRERYWLREQHECKDRWQNLFPNQVVSYKRHVRPNQNKVPQYARIVSCHGRPRPHELLRLPWVTRNWK